MPEFKNKIVLITGGNRFVWKCSIKKIFTNKYWRN